MNYITLNKNKDAEMSNTYDMSTKSCLQHMRGTVLHIIFILFTFLEGLVKKIKSIGTRFF